MSLAFEEALIGRRRGVDSLTVLHQLVVDRNHAGLNLMCKAISPNRLPSMHALIIDYSSVCAYVCACMAR